jgi:RND family efflux transporter MFP subunit
MKRGGCGSGVLAVVIGLGLTGCDDAGTVAEAPVRPVRVVEVEERAAEQRVTLSGVVEAQTEVSLGFRIGGRIVERLVDVGDQLTAGQLIARLDPSDEQNALRSARAALSAAESQLAEAMGNYDRQAQLLERGFTTRQRFDEAQRARLTAQAQADSAAAQLEIALTRVADTELRADAPGSVTTRGAEAGEVVQPGAMVVRIARDGGRDAVFDAPESLLRTAPRNPEVAVALSIDPSVTAIGRVREVAPTADAQTGAFRVRVGLDAPPEAMRLGSIVTGSVVIGGAPGMALPASALTRLEGGPAVWVVDPASETVSLRAVEVSRHGPGEVVLSGGVAPGEIVVTAGVQALRPGQQVRVPGAGS